MSKHSGKSYECRDALVAAMLAMATKDGKDVTPDVRALLKEHTDIPEERLDFAASEVGQIMFGLRQVAKLLAYVSESPEVLREGVEATVGSGCLWKDDDKRNLSLKVYAETTDEEPLAEIKTKLKAEAAK